MNGLRGSPCPLQTNSWVSHQIFEKMRQLGSKSDLYQLRQLDEEYYKTLNPTFLDVEDKCISFVWSNRITKYFQRCGERPYVQAFVKEGVNEKKITRKKWTERDNKAFHIFRKLKYENVEFRRLRSDPFLYEISIKLAPYITTLRFNTLHLDEKERGGQIYAEFLNGFTSLKNLKIDCILFNSDRTAGNILKLNQIGSGLENLKLKPQIKLYADGGYDELLTKFANKANTSFILKFRLPSSRFCDFPNPKNELENIVKTYGNLTNVKYKISVYRAALRNLSQLEAFTRTVLQLDAKIKKLKLTLDFQEGNHEFNLEDRSGIRNCLAQMSPFVKKLIIVQQHKPAWDILPRESEWPEMTQLRIDGYQHPLNILKNCSKLQKLGLDVDQASCIFSNNTQQTEQENLVAYFGTLDQLTELVFPPKQKPEDKFIEGNELHKYLKSMLPQLKTIKYGEFDKFKGHFYPKK